MGLLNVQWDLLGHCTFTPDAQQSHRQEVLVGKKSCYQQALAWGDAAKGLSLGGQHRSLLTCNVWHAGKPMVKLPYHVRVMVPCYKEELEIIRRTLMAAYDAALPEGCNRTIYLCDDGKDPQKCKL